MAIFIGFYGYLMPGAINLASLELFLNKQNNKLFLFIVLALIMEFVYCFFILKFSLYLNELNWLNQLLNILIIIFLAFIGIWSWLDSRKSELLNKKGLVKRGFFMIFFHPQQVPFYLIWGQVFIANHWINQNNFILLVFCINVIFGSLICLILYVFVGNKLIQLFSLKYKTINKILAIFYLFIALILIIKEIYN